MRQVQPFGPYNLLGWSLGGNIAHAVACALQERGEEVRTLALMDSYPVLGGRTVENVPLDPVVDLLELGEGNDLTAEEDFFKMIAHSSAQLLQAIKVTPTRRFSGRILFFTATMDRDDSFPGFVSWRPYVSDVIENHDIDVRHGEMMQNDPLAKMAIILSGALAMDEPH
jgi:thioesterase domain-containing protein